ncbi:MAG: LamG domain-containing protein, partial [Bacteroidales bacterium]|nr:LamG domain-containing protein [Bacteroidales bacterium]
KPLTTGRGSFVGILKFDIGNHATLTNSTLSSIQFNTSTVVGDFSIFDVSGNDMESQSTLANASDFTIRGLTILNPNGPNEAVNRYKQYPSLTVVGYPVYFERSGLITPAVGNVYGSNILAYAVDYSTNNGGSWSTEVMRFAETRLTAQELVDLGTDGNHVSGEITTSTGTSAGYYVTQGDGSQLPVESNPGYGGVVRIIWTGDRFFAPRSEQALLRVTQLSESGNSAAITSRKYAPGAADVRTGAPYDISDAPFVLSRLFFLQLNGDLYSTNTYLRTREPYSNPHVLTVEAWVNLNSYTENTEAEPAIVAVGPGMAAPSQEGAWMLYLHQGKFPAFRALESTGTHGENGSKYIATVISPDSLTITSDAFPINDNAGHPENWYHIAATVNQNVVRLYVNGELKVEKTNNNAVDVRMPTYSHPVWIGLNPMGTIDSSSYFHGGLKEVKVWRKALSQADIRS